MIIVLSEIILGSVLGGTAVPLTLYGVKLALYRDVDAAQFAPGRYDPRKDPSIAGELPRAKEIVPAKSLLLVLAGGITIGGLIYTVVGIASLALAGSLLGLAAPRLWLNWQKSGREKLLAAQMEQAVEIMAAVLRSGGGLPGALERAAAETGAPLREKLAITAAEIRMGVSTADAFQRLAGRVSLPEMSMLSMAVEFQQTGMAVNMASVFSQMQENIRGRQAFAEEISALTAENRLAGWIVAAVPFTTISIMRQIAPEFIAPLFDTPIGLIVFGVSTAVIIAGIVWIMRMASPDNR